jgi:hypothetical protein
MRTCSLLYGVAAAARAAGPPDWARGKSVEMMADARARRRELPIASDKAAPAFK